MVEFADNTSSEISHSPTKEDLPEDVISFFIEHWNKRVLYGKSPASVRSITADYLKHSEVLIIEDEDQKILAARAFNINGRGSLSLTAPDHQGNGYGFSLAVDAIERVIAHTSPEKPEIILATDSPGGKKLCQRCVTHFGDRATFLVG